MVPVKRYDVAVTWDHVLTSLSQVTSAKGSTSHPDVPPLLDKVNELAGQLKEAVAKINELDPKVLQRRVGDPGTAPGT
jgi:hypothetical protein